MKKQTPTLTIITVCYNIKDEIERTCKSIAGQTWRDFEWIVVDGGSTDGTVEILNKYKKQMSVFISEKDNGIYNAMNKGIKLAKGKYLNFMNGGDMFDSDNTLEKVFKNREYDADVLYGDDKLIKSNGEMKVRHFPAHVDKKFFIERSLCHQSSFIKRDLFEKYGMYNENFRIVSDWEKWIVFMDNNCVFQHLDLVVGVFASGGVSSTMSPLHVREREEVHRKYYPVLVESYSLFGFIPILKIEEKF